MKRRMMVALLAICLLMSFCVPAVLATEAGADMTDAPTVEYRFSDYATNGEYLVNCTKNIMISYGAKTINWRFEAASHGYQFRVQERHPNAPGTGKNMFIANTIQFFGAENWWYALRLRAPETGKYALTLTKSGRAETEVYFFSAKAIEKALGDNAAEYAETVCEDPYLAEGTEAFQKYREVIDAMLAEATPVMTAVTQDVKKMTGECSFSSEDEYVMVIKYVSKESLTAQVSNLSATRIGEAENIPGEDLLDEGNGENNFDWKAVLIPVAAVVVVGGMVATVIALRKKSSKKTEE